MTTIDELDEMNFVNWDAAGAETGFPGPSEGAATQSSVMEETNMGLVLENINDDDWSFWALEHFDSTQPPQDLGIPAFEDPLSIVSDLDAQFYWETPETPCRNCAEGGYQCKLIKDPKYNGYCTSCVALRRECSFGTLGNTSDSEPGVPFPANPWPTIGDRPETSILHEDDLAHITGMAGPNTGSQAKSPSPTPPSMPKIGARFSRESVRILKNWVSTHNRHPYPTEEEKDGLQRITGLNKTQITNWLANARRRGKIQPNRPSSRSTSPHVGRGYVSAIDIPKRRGTPALFENMNPLQRWANSPPENEPASVTAIARAVTASSSAVSSSSGLNSPYISGNSDDGSSRSLCNQSSASSFSVSQSSGSFASSFSHQSRSSFGSVSIPSFARNRGRRRRRRAPPKPAEHMQTLTQPLKTFQCTFCTETFRTKHDWQRHEKSLHLSLERWVCSPDGAKAVNPENGLISCVFCGQLDPDDAHIESHNFSSCVERTVEERTFYRKDHLRQHLKLVHNVKFLPWAMDKWRVATPEIRSRCGFCGTVMDSWTIRVDHLAEHFKTGNTMADWKGDWGFDEPVLEMVENSIPPYMIHDERNTPLPFMASQTSPATPTNAYELIKGELMYFASRWLEDTGRLPNDEEIQLEACRIIMACDVQIGDPNQLAPSWLRDLVLSKKEIKSAAILGRQRAQSENRLAILRINGKNDIFESCEFEIQLQDFVKARTLLGLTAMDTELQVEACKIIGRIEEKSSDPSEAIANWLLRLIYQSTTWLSQFRKRAHLPRSEDINDVDTRPKDLSLIDSTIHNYSRLDRELGEYLQIQRSLGFEPSDSDLQLQARLIIYENPDSWNQTAADDEEWLQNFKERQSSAGGGALMPMDDSLTSPFPHNFDSDLNLLSPLRSAPATCLANVTSPQTNQRSTVKLKAGPFFFNDANCYRRLERDLRRFVASTMSVNNPNCHVPTDEELQFQARLIVYDDDDTWNQTAADNAEWLQRFKRDVGILPPGSGPGLPLDKIPWRPEVGGSGFAPPYVCPNPNASIEPLAASPKIFSGNSTRTLEPDAATANRFLQSFTHRYPAPAKIFCSRELENGLAEYVRREMQKTGVFPSDDQMRERARQILSMQKTPADDPVLLSKFKAAVQSGLLTQPTISGRELTAPVPVPAISTPGAAEVGSLVSEPFEDIGVFPTDMDLDISTQELNNIFQDMDSWGNGNEPDSDPDGGGGARLGTGSGFEL